jgi:CRISPR/Cas system CSM-associated protein Csm3 (group 7 of RAMP superfamily)
VTTTPAPAPSPTAPVWTYVRVKLSMDSEWRVGTWRHGNADDGEDRAVVAVARTDEGEESPPYLPGSSVRGSLRAHLRDRLGPQCLAEVFGPEPPQDREGGQDLVASPWWVLGAVLPDASWVVRRRGQTSIDRWRRAPLRGTLRDSETVDPVGSGPHVNIYLRCTDAGCRSDVLDALGTWCPRIGAGRTTGLGRARVVEVVHRDIDLDDDTDLIDLLTAGGGPVGVDTLLASCPQSTAIPAQGTDDLVLRVVFSLPHGWLPRATPEAPERDRLDGSTWKGLLRHRVEFIARSLGQDVCGDRRLDNGSWQCCHCDVCAAFGSPLQAGVLDFTTTRLNGTGNTSTRRRTAIDRFTGGAKDGALFAETVQTAVQLRLDIRAPAAKPSTNGITPWVVRALLHAVRDLSDGLVGVGVGSGTGLGTLEASTVTLGAGWHSCLPGVTAVPGGSGQQVVQLAMLASVPVVEVES